MVTWMTCGARSSKVTALIHTTDALDSRNRIVTKNRVFIQHLPDLQFRNSEPLRARTPNVAYRDIGRFRRAPLMQIRGSPERPQ